MSDLAIRGATEGDMRAVAEVHVEGWQWGYRGQLPAEFLARLSIERREEWWLGFLKKPEARLWVRERGGAIVGFASTAPSEDRDVEPNTAELLAIYLKEDAAGTGVGRALMEHVLDDFQARGFVRATLWVLESNARTRRFYEIAGWRPDGATKTEGAGEVQLHEVRYRIELA